MAVDWMRVTNERLGACRDLRRAVGDWFGPVDPSMDTRSWLAQRQLELAVRSIHNMDALVLLSEHRLWSPAYAASRMLVEDAAVAYWLLDHPDVGALQVRWTEHRDAARLGDHDAQVQIGLPVDAATATWHAKQDAVYLDHVGHRHRKGAKHWTGKSVAELVAGACGRGASTRHDWEHRLRLLKSTQTRFLMIGGIGVHHSPSASQNWCSPPEEMLPDALRIAWFSFGLHAAVIIEEFAPQHTEALRTLYAGQRGPFEFPE